MLSYFWIGLGSALGGMGRHWVSEWSAKHFGVEFPWGTLIVNGVGSFLIGFISVFAFSEQKAWLGLSGQQFLMIGVLGGFTTFSSFSLQNLNLFYAGAWERALINVFSSLIICLGGVWLGYELANVVARR